MFEARLWTIVVITKWLKRSFWRQLKLWPSWRRNFDISCDHKVCEAINFTARAITSFFQQAFGHQLRFNNFITINLNRNSNCEMFGAIFETKIVITIISSNVLDGNCEHEGFESIRWAAILITRVSKRYFRNELRLRDLWGNALDGNCDYEVSEAISWPVITITRFVRQYFRQQLQLR